MTNKGMTLVELVIAVTVIGIALAALGISFEDWIGRYSVEKETKQLYCDLMLARTCALNRDLKHFVLLDGRHYSIVEDTNDDGVMDPNDRVFDGFPKELSHTIDYNNGNKVIFNSRGLMANLGTVRFVSDKAPDYDCIKIAMSRIITGRYDAPHGTCEAK
jgi:prepilin-type N-terminal cleavage/methylation domain-containing protein